MQKLRLVTIPFLVLHGTADRVTDPLASQDLYNDAASVHKDIRLYDGFLHDLLFEPERDDIGADIIAWMEKTLERRFVKWYFRKQNRNQNWPGFLLLLVGVEGRGFGLGWFCNWGNFMGSPTKD
jgi:Serine aminopeptidase, S33